MQIVHMAQYLLDMNTAITVKKVKLQKWETSANLISDNIDSYSITGAGH